MRIGKAVLARIIDKHMGTFSGSIGAHMAADEILEKFLVESQPEVFMTEERTLVDSKRVGFSFVIPGSDLARLTEELFLAKIDYQLEEASRQVRELTLQEHRRVNQ